MLRLHRYARVRVRVKAVDRDFPLGAVVHLMQGDNNRR